MAPSTKKREKVNISTIDMTFPGFADAWLMALSDAAPRLPIVTVDKANFAGA